MSNLLIERISSTLDRMTNYQINEEAEGPDPTEEERASWLPPRLHDFLFHLSSPVVPGNFAVPVDEDGIAHINRGHQK